MLDYRKIMCYFVYDIFITFLTFDTQLGGHQKMLSKEPLPELEPEEESQYTAYDTLFLF